MAHLRLQHNALKAELAAVKEGLSSSTERAEKLQEEGQVSGTQALLTEEELELFAYSLNLTQILFISSPKTVLWLI